MLPLDLPVEPDIIEECRSLAAEALAAEGDMPELAAYLVRPDYLPFSACSKTGIKLRYRDQEVALDDLAEGRLSYPEIPELTENFEIYRVYAPAGTQDVVRSHLEQRRERDAPAR